MTDKVYCIYCLYYYRTKLSAFPDDFCRAFENMKDTYRSPKSKPMQKPSDINKNNNCKWFIKLEPTPKVPRPAGALKYLPKSEWWKRWTSKKKHQ